ncbi:hypothetical protein GOBAR_AA16465 [Gossypium barbadense]|uniref:CHCH domain-containing protein n=1 Tax=Gossypium barbadense TaxID=3634 RepID=A0A2P5XLJ8_GOSBA|nr:hypothetical protein GOBAR_AA16465 [Gossypium barbadense]
MSLEAYASAKQDEIHTDVLLQARQACYKARDAFYSCLEKHSDKKPTEIGSVGLLYPTECKPSREDYVKNCRVSWEYNHINDYTLRWETGYSDGEVYAF